MTDPKRKIGPNLKKLMIHKMAIEAVPPGGDFLDALKVIASPELLKKQAMEAMDWAIAAVDVVRSSPDNHLGSDEETIAGEVVRRIEERKAEQMLMLRKK